MNEDKLLVKIAEIFGENLSARVKGIEILEYVKKIHAESPNSKIIFDFSGVTNVTTGFAKELFGELFKLLREDFKNIIGIQLSTEQDFIRSTIIIAISSVSGDIANNA